MTLPPAQVVSVTNTSSDVQVITGACLFRGYSIVETTGSAGATAHFDDGTATNAPRITVISLLQGTMWSDWFDGPGIALRTGLYLDVTAGSVRATFYYTPITHREHHEWAFGEWRIRPFPG